MFTHCSYGGGARLTRARLPYGYQRPSWVFSRGAYVCGVECGAKWAVMITTIALMTNKRRVLLGAGLPNQPERSVDGQNPQTKFIHIYINTHTVQRYMAFQSGTGPGNPWPGLGSR